MKGKEAFLPKLRFPEFRNAGDWQEKKLYQACEVNPKRENLPENFIYIDLESVEAGTLLQKNEISRNAAPSRAQRLLEYGDIVFQLVRPYQKNNLLFQEQDGSSYVASTGYAQLRPKQSNIYLYQYLHTDSFVEKVISRSIGSNYPAISSGDLSKILVIVPEPNEQQKIGACLTSLDQLIGAETRKLDNLRNYKKGLMQQLFPQENEDMPRLRFPEFQQMRGWDKKLMQELYSFHPTNSYSRELLNDIKGQVRNIHYGDIHTKYSTLFDIEKETVPFLNTSVSLEKIQPESYCREGDIVFADASEDLNDVGKSIEIVKLNDKKLVSGLHTILARQKQEELIIGFGGYLFRSALIRAQIMKEAHGAKVAGISARRLSSIEIRYPWEQKEQQKILACLSSLDELIAVQNRRLDFLRIHKKGLMQQLFPEVDEALS